MSFKGLAIEDKDIFPLEIGYLPRFAVQKCEEELNETPESKTKGLQELRSLLQKNEKSEGVDFCEDFLVGYLRRNKYRVKDAHQQIQNFIHLYKTEIVFEVVPDAYLDLPSSKFLVLLPLRCQDACALFLCRWGKWDPSELPFERLKQILMMMLFQALRDPMTQINGFKIIHDLEGMNFKQLKYCTPNNLLLFYNCVVNCAPARYKELHIVSESHLLKFMWGIVKPILSEKIKNRVRLHNNKDELFQYFPRCIMPMEYGGDIREADMDNWTKRANTEQKKFTLQGQPNLY